MTSPRGAMRTPGFVSLLDTRTQRAFVANQQSDSVSVLDTRTGLVVRTISMRGQPLAMAVDTWHGRLFVATRGMLQLDLPGAGMWAQHVVAGTSGIAVVDTRTGQLLRTLPTAHVPYTLALDGRRRRLIALEDGESLRTPTMMDKAPQWLRHILGLPRGGQFTPHVPATVVVLLDIASHDRYGAA